MHPGFLILLVDLYLSRSARRMSHAIIKDLVGNSVDRWLQASNTHALLLLYWEKCTHCESLMPAFEKVAARVQKANEQVLSLTCCYTYTYTLIHVHTHVHTLTS